MSIRQQITDALKAARSQSDSCTLSTLQLVCAALRDREASEHARGIEQDLSDAQVIELLETMIAMRRNTANKFREEGVLQRARDAEDEIDVIMRFVPRQMTSDEIAQAVAEAISDSRASGLKDMARVMRTLKQRYPGRIDRVAASALVKERLG